MQENQLIVLSRAFAVRTINTCFAAKERRKATVIINQLLRSGTSIGANIHEANYASSKVDFINKLQIAMKECYETEYWLELFQRAAIADPQATAGLSRACGTMRRMLVASVNTAKQNDQANKAETIG